MMLSFIGFVVSDDFDNNHALMLKKYCRFYSCSADVTIVKKVRHSGGDDGVGVSVGVVFLLLLLFVAVVLLLCFYCLCYQQ